MLAFIITTISAAYLGYIYGHYIRPKARVRQVIKEIREKCQAVLQEGHKGVYRTIVTDKDQSSELVVEVEQLAVTKNGQVKVRYLSAFYKNPTFRTRQGDALLKEVHGLLGNYLPFEEIEWYETNEQHENIKKYLHSLTYTPYSLP